MSTEPRAAARVIPAAAIKVGDTVRFLGDQPHEVTVARIENSTPVSGFLSWTDTEGRPWTVSAAERVDLVRMASQR